MRGDCVSMDRSTLRILVGTLVILAAPSVAAEAQKGDAFGSRLRRFLDDHCVACHGPELQRRRLRLDRIPPTFDVPEVASTWVNVLDRLSAGEMPPKGR